METRELINRLARVVNNEEDEYHIDFYELTYDNDQDQSIIDYFESPVKCVYNDREGVDKDTQVYVLYFPRHDVYLKISGWYSSYNGEEMDSDTIQVVHPRTQTVTVYEPDISFSTDEEWENSYDDLDDSYGESYL